MKTNTIIGIVVALVAVGGIYYGSTKSSNTPNMTSPDADMQVALAATPAAKAESGKFTGTLADLTSRVGDWKCTVDSSTSAGVQSVSAGVVYVSNKKVRADFNTAVSGFGSITSSMIADGEYVWSWSSMSPAGVKAKMIASGASATSGATSGSAADANQAYSYDCQPSTVDASLFVLPTSITFTEVGK